MARYIDLVDRAKALLQSEGYTDVFVKRLDAMTGREGIVIRRMPSTAVDRYWDGDRGVSYLYQVVTRYRSEKKAIQTADELAYLLDGASVPSNNGSYRFVGQEVYTEPQELALDEAGFYAHEFRIRATITIER